MQEKVKEIYNEITQLKNTLSLLNWDQSTYMPKKGVESRSDIIESLTKMLHEKVISDEFYHALHQSLEDETLQEKERAEFQKILRDVDRERKIPVKLAAEMAKTVALAMSAWETAKQNNDDTHYLPLLEKVISLKKETVECLGYEDNPYDTLLDEYDQGLKFNYIENCFNTLQKEISDILKIVRKNESRVDDSLLFLEYDINKQWEFGLSILKDMGIDFDSFRQDQSMHPFTTTLGIGDVRVTTNITAMDFKKGFYSTVHEGGHALYEINTGFHLQKSPFAHLESLSLHESQSRFYENIIGRSELFWNSYFPLMQKLFPENTSGKTASDYFKAVNKVEINPVRIESDEVTYNLHILLRAQLENDIINDRLQIKDIHEKWNDKSKELFGFVPQTKKEGYLQDIHWSDGLFGYFPTYTMGNLISAQLFAALKKETGELKVLNPDVFKQIFQWFDKNIYQHGSRYSSMELLKKITGEELNADYFVNYIRGKIEKIYK